MQFTKATLKFETHREIGLKSVLSARFEIGRMLTRVVTFASGPVRYAPPEERFYLGGANSVRGFAQNQLGPIVRVETPTAGTIVSAIGGNSMVLASLEGRFPIPLAFKGLFGALFIDAGQVGDRTMLGVSGFRVTPGFGFRIASVLGPARLDFGFNPYGTATAPLYHEEGDRLVLKDPSYRPRPGFFDRVRMNLSVGQAF
jgi:outer membrane protein insertion porin family/translocation and assembly module TamA